MEGDSEAPSSVPTLVELCINLVVAEPSLLQREAVSSLPDQIAQSIYEELQNSKKITNHRILRSLRHSTKKVSLTEVGHLVVQSFASELGKWSKLRELSLLNLSNRLALHWRSLSRLRVLEIDLQVGSNDASGEVDPEIAHLSKLKDLVIQNGGSYNSFEFLSKMEKLASLTLINTTGKSIRPFQKHPSLVELVLQEVAQEPKTSVNTLTRLVQLSIFGISANDVPILSKISQITSLKTFIAEGAALDVTKTFSALAECRRDNQTTTLVTPTKNNSTTISTLPALAEYMKHMIHSVSIMKIAGKISIAPGLMSTDDLKMTLRVLKYCYRNESLAISWIKNLYRGLFLPKGGFAPTLYDPLAGVPAILVSFLNQNWTDKPDVGLAREAAFSILGLFRAAEKAESAHPQNKKWMCAFWRSGLAAAAHKCWLAFDKATDRVAFCEMIAIATNTTTLCAPKHAWNPDSPAQFMVAVMSDFDGAKNSVGYDQSRWCTWGLASLVNQCQMGNYLAAPDCFFVLFGHLTTTPDAANVNIFPLVLGVVIAKGSLDLIYKSHPDFINEIKKRIQVVTELKPLRCLAIMLQNAWQAIPEWREAGYNDTELLDLLLDKCCTLPPDSACCFSDSIRALSKTDQQRQRCIDIGLTDKIIDIVNNVKTTHTTTKFLTTANMAANFLSLIDKYPPARILFSQRLQLDYIDNLLDCADLTQNDPKLHEAFTQAMYAFSHPLINLAILDPNPEYTETAERHQKKYLDLKGISQSIQVIQKKISVGCVENLMCATEAWLWHNEAGRLEFIEQGGIETFVLSNLEPKFVVVAGTLKNMMLYGKGKIKKAVRTRLMTSDIIKKVLDFIQNEENHKQDVSKLAYAALVLVHFTYNGRKTCARLRMAGVIDVILNLYDTANRNIDNPKWQEVLKNCLSLLSSLGSKDAYPKGGKVCSLCLRDLKSNPKVSQCAMCLDLVCETCAKVVKVHNDHNIVFEDVEQSFAVDIFLKNGLLRRMISTLERHQDLPVTITDNVISIFIACTYTREDVAEHLLRGEEGDLVNVLATITSTATYGKSPFSLLQNSMYYPNCADILVKNTKILDNIVHQLLNDSSDAREAAALAIVNIQSRLVDLGIIEKLVKVVQSENEGELQKTNATQILSQLSRSTTARKANVTEMHRLGLFDTLIKSFVIHTSDKLRRNSCILMGQLDSTQVTADILRLIAGYIEDRLAKAKEVIAMYPGALDAAAKKEKELKERPKFKENGDMDTSPETPADPTPSEYSASGAGASAGAGASEAAVVDEAAKVKKAITPIIDLSDSVKNMIDKDSKVDRLIQETGVYKALAQVMLVKEMIQSSDYNFFNFLVASGGKSRKHFMNEWYAVGNADACANWFLQLESPPNAQIAEYVHVALIMFAKHLEPEFIATLRKYPTLVPKMLDVCLDMETAYGLPGVLIWSGFRDPEVTFKHLNDNQQRIIDAMNHPRTGKQQAACRALESIENTGRRTGIEELIRVAAQNFQKTTKPELRKAYSTAILAMIKDRPSYVSSLCSSEHMRAALNALLEIRDEPQTYVASYIIDLGIFHTAERRQAKWFCGELPRVVVALQKALRRKWTLTSLRSPAMMISYLLSVLVSRCSKCHAAVRNQLIDLVPSMLVTTDVGIKDAAHHYAYACLVVASLTYTQTKEHGMDALMQIANNSIFAAKYGSISSASEMINLLLKRMFEELNNELETEPDVSIILPCFSSMASTGEFVNAMTDEQVNQCIKMFLSTYAEAQAESVKVLLAILMYRPDKCASMLTTEVLEAAIKFSMISWNLDAVTARVMLFIFWLAQHIPGGPEIVKEHAGLAQSAKSWKISPSTVLNAAGMLYRIEFCNEESLPKPRKVIALIKELSESEYANWSTLGFSVSRAMVKRYPTEKVPFKELSSVIRPSRIREPFVVQVVNNLLDEILDRDPPLDTIKRGLKTAKKFKSKTLFTSVRYSAKLQDAIDKL